MATLWHTLSIEKALEISSVSEHGLSHQEAEERLKKYGLNVLPEEKPRSVFNLFFSQFQSALIYVLLGACLVVYIAGETTDAVIILFVLIFNAVVGAIQEGKAQNTLNALKKVIETSARVIRENKDITIPDRDVVPGDILVLEEGARIPADARVIVAHNLKVDEASLTGESSAVHKITDQITKEETSSADQHNMVFQGTNIVAGMGKAVVVATGTHTVIGAIAKKISSINTEIPLKANIRFLSEIIILVVACLSLVLFGIGIVLGHPAREMFLIVVSLAVSVIPEGLPIVMTLVLATGVWRMSKQNALVKKLQAVEALGQARVIAVDKTGTITKNELVIHAIWTDNKQFDISGVGYESEGDVVLQKATVDAANHPELLLMGKIAALTSNARLSYNEERKMWQVAGDPTEAALSVFAQKVGFEKEDLLTETPLIGEIPFDYTLKYHATLHTSDGGHLLTVMGTPEVVLEMCNEIRHDGKNHAMSPEDRDHLEKIITELSSQGFRVLAAGIRTGNNLALKPDAIKDLSFVGFVAMKDALRSEATAAIERARQAGIKVVMITGDHKATARSLAKEAGIYREGDEILTGTDIDTFSESELVSHLTHVSVFARVTPDHKLRIINAYKKRGEIIAMTGDGVNDAPSLVAADLGISMGIIGTEVAKEASDIVLLDDNFSSIVTAIEEGRSIYKTIKKVILYLFSTSIGEALTIMGALLLGYPLPLVAAQIIWLNFVTDGFLDVALAMEPKEKGLLSETFEHPKKYIVDKLMAERMVVMAIPMMLGTLYLFQQYFSTDLTKAWTISLSVLAVFQWFNAWNCRSESKSIFQINPFSNMYLVGATVLIIGLHMLAVYHPFMQGFLKTVPLTLAEWLIIVPMAASIVVVEEVRKLMYRKSFANATARA
jgi:Ca2+-transporting ATPase